jgi:hypothetical protein
LEHPITKWAVLGSGSVRSVAEFRLPIRDHC